MLAFQKIFCVLALLLAPSLLHADTYSDDMMRNLSREDGLSGETVTDIVTAPDGQVWVATNDGVCRYNGREVTAFDMPRKGKDPNYTFDIEFSSDRTLYAATKDGLFRLKRGENSFKQIYPSLKNVETVLAVGDELYAGNRQGFHVLKDGKVKTFTVGATPMGIENGVRDIQLGEDKGVWFVSRYALNRYDQKTGKVTSYDLSHLLPERAALANFIPIAGHFFIGTKNNGLYIYSLRTKTIRKVEGIGNSIGSVLKTSDKKVCIAGSGAFLLDGKTGKVLRQFTRKNKDGKGELPTEAVYCYYRDENGVDWFGLYRYGLCYTYHSEKLFKIYGFGNFTSEGLDVRGVFVNGCQKVIGSNDDLWLVDEGRGIVRHYTSEQLGNAHAISSIAYYNGCYYVGSFDTGLHRFSATTFDLLPNPPEPLLSTVTIGTLRTDGRGNLWIGTSEGLFILDGNDRLRHFTENNSRIVGGQISAICFMPNGTAWVGGPAGLSISLPQAPVSFEKDHFPNGFFGTSKIKEINPGHGGLYFFNSENAIYFSDKSMQRFGEFEPSRNMSVNGCVSFLDDLHGHYWIATSDGLFCSDYDKKDVLHFGYGEGLRCQLIAGKFFMDTRGTIWIGTSNGLMYVRVADLKSWQKRAHYKMLLYHISVDGNPVGLGVEDEANDHRRLSLKWNITSSVMTVRPLLADFARPFGRIYEYRVDGRGEWLVVRDGEDIRLHNLSLGNHRLELRLAGVPGTMSVYDVTVLPSGWAVLELLLLIAAIVALILWYRYHKNAKQLLAERNEIEDALVESEELREASPLPHPVESPSPTLHDGSGSASPFPLSSEGAGGRLHEGAEERLQGGAKYERVHIDEGESKMIVDRLKKYIETEKAYLNPDLKMSDLADYLHLSPSKLSQVFSLYLKENWYDFINGYRLAEFKRLIDEGAYKQYTLLALSAKCGFKKSSFFSTFRKVEGMTPTEYMKKVKK